ncbi:MAG: ankyrin repeat domain-containing protein [Verrucomicrobiales bacterium]|nr:ankyrin repeat domain-containing protein [Verrucomicrobiales bacterium]
MTQTLRHLGAVSTDHRASPLCRSGFGPLLLLLLSLSVHAGDADLADAVESLDRPRIQQLLKASTELNASQPDGMTALHWAVYHDDSALTRRLIKAGADVAATNRYGVAALSIACQNGGTELVELLLAAGADPNTSQRGGETALMTAARTGKAGPVQALLKRGARVDAEERRGQTALLWAAAEGHADVVEMLLHAGANPRKTLPDSGFTAFFLAAREGRGEVVRVLLKAGIDVNEAMQPRKVTAKGPRKGTSALLLAIENGHFEVAVDLLKAGADPNDQRSGFTPLHALTWVRKPSRGEDDGDPTPLGSGRLNSLQFAQRLVDHGADVNARLTQGKASPGSFARAGATPFLMAAATADTAYLRALVDWGADPSLANNDGCTPLMVAAGIGVGSAAANEVAGTEPEVLEAIQFLLDHGANVNAVDAHGETAMHGAAYKNLPQVITWLADHGASSAVWNRTNKYGWTPLAIAQGHRPGNFKPSAETVDALQRVMRPRSSPP